MRTTLVRLGFAIAAAVALVANSYATDVPANLGFGLDKLVESRNITKRDPTRALYRGFATEQAASYADAAIRDVDSDRVKVDIVPTGHVAIDALKDALQSTVPSLSVTSVDATYRGIGLIEAYVSVDDAAALARADGVRSVFLALRPYLRHAPVQEPNVLPGDHLYKIGTAFDQGVIQHRVDRINQIYNPSAPVNYDGTGISIGIMSDSFNTRSAAPHAATGVANLDLPGSATNPWNTQPVVVLEDEAGGTDEGRGMAEIAYKMAPRARLAFATADSGEVGFANNIRALAALPGFEYAAGVQQGFKADVIADDVGYFDEPWYADGVIGNAIDDVAAAGVSYFSSAGNDIGINGYESPLRLVANGAGMTAAGGNGALANTNIDLTGVPANLYAGGFHNFNPAAGQLDVAQLVNLGSTQFVVMQWDDPYDSRALPTGTQVFSSSGTLSTATPTVTFGAPALPIFDVTKVYVIKEVATSGTLDGTISVFDASNNLVYTQDNDIDETVNFYPPATGQYHITVGRFSTTSGNFNITVNETTGPLEVTTDLNLLVFSTAGVYQSTRSLTSNNLASNRPIELGQFNAPSGGQVQFVIARANNPVAGQLPTRVRWLIPGNGAGSLGPAEYFKYNTVTTGGHATAAGCNGTAAYSVFKPNQPEGFTSPGPATILFDKDANRLAVPDVREQPRVAAADAANTSFFSGDVNTDLDSNPNFSGTSAAAPHAAAIAALVLQSRGGSGSVTPAQMTKILQDSAFPHDLDPAFSSGTAVTSDGGTVSISINSDGDSNINTGQNDTSSFQVTYTGASSLATLTFNPAGTDAAGGNVTGGNNGPQDDVGSFPATISYFENSFPGLAFLPAGNGKPFTLGPLTGLAASDIVAPLAATPFTGFSNPSPAPGNGTSQFRTMSIGFPTGNFTSGAVMRFTVGRGAQHSSAVGTVASPVNGQVTINQQADLFGGGVLIPEGTVISDGMTFSGTTTSGATFSGTIKNLIGHGYSVLDGYGFIDASAATNGINGTGTAAPASAFRSGAVTFTVNVTPATSPASSGINVIANLTSIGGSASQAFLASGNTFTFSTTVGANALAGNKSIPVSISDAQSRTGNITIPFTVLAPTSSSGIAAATPSAVSVTQSSLLTVAVTPGSGPTSTGITVKADLSSIGGSATQALNDAGANGDLAPSDGTYSFNATVPLGTAPGIKTIPITITDTQARTSTTNITLTINTPTAPTGAGSATPSTVAPTDTTTLTVAVTPGGNPPSTGLTVSANLSSIGGSATQGFVDNGDGTFSFAATVALNTSGGAKSLPVLISDAQTRVGTTSIALTVNASTAPSATGTASPATIAATESTTLTVTVTPGTNPASTVLAVSADLTSIGGSATQAFTDNGDGTFTFVATAPLGTAPGARSLPITVTDAQSRSGTSTIALTISAPTPLSATGSATPQSVVAGGTTHLVVTVVPGTKPASTGVQVSIDLSSIGGSATQAMTDDGSGTSFSFDATVDAATSPGVKLLLATVTDGQGRSASTTLGLNVPTPGSPFATGIAVSVLPGNTVVLQVAVTPGSDPVSTGVTVSVDLSAIGGSATQQFFDDGTNGDQTSGDGVYSFAFAVDSGTAIGTTFNLPVTVTDSQTRTGAGVIELKTLLDRIFLDGFDSM
jgi:hypothetical protein